MARSYFFGLTPDKELVGGDTALITLENQKESLFEWFKKHECIVGFIFVRIANCNRQEGLLNERCKQTL